jgi:hypothetical protein
MQKIKTNQTDSNENRKRKPGMIPTGDPKTKGNTGSKGFVSQFPPLPKREGSRLPASSIQDPPHRSLLPTTDQAGGGSSQSNFHVRSVFIVVRLLLFFAEGTQEVSERGVEVLQNREGPRCLP